MSYQRYNQQPDQGETTQQANQAVRLNIDQVLLRIHLACLRTAHRHLYIPARAIIGRAGTGIGDAILAGKGGANPLDNSRKIRVTLDIVKSPACLAGQLGKLGDVGRYGI